jgi:HEAT repeat protein
VEPIERTRNGRVADQDTFFQKAVLAFQNSDEPERRGEVLRSLISCNLLIPFLRARTELTAIQIAELLQLAMPLLPSVDLKLARYLCDERYNIDHETLLKFLGALTRVSHPRRIAGTLLPLLADSDSRVRSKAARLMNIGEDDKAWRTAETDPRVLANLIEALWDVETPNRRTRFWKAVNSASPRVAGNALVGLYRIGDEQAKALIIRMAGHPAAEFRRTAVWAMGETGDVEFLGCLSALLARETGSVRVNVLRSLARIRKRLAGATSAADASAGKQQPPPPEALAPGAVPPGYVA